MGAGILSSLFAFNIGAEIGYKLVPPGGDLSLRLYPISLPAILGFLSMGSVIGLFQWFVLRRRLADAWAWIPLSALAFPLAIEGLELLIPYRINPDGLLFVIPVSVIQWLYLRRHVTRSSSWIYLHAGLALIVLLLGLIPSSAEVDCCIDFKEQLIGSLIFGILLALPGTAGIALIFRAAAQGSNGAA